MSETEENLATVDSQTFRQVVGHLPSGVTVITARHEGKAFAMTASSVTTLSADPALMIACVNNAVPTAAAIAGSGHYAVNVLGERHGHLAVHFASPKEDKFAGVATSVGVGGVPLLDDALATLECEVVETVVGGTHSMFIGRVVAARAESGQPLTYFRGGFGRFEFASDDAAYREARELVLRRTYAPQEVITTESLAERLSVDAAAAFYALTRLSADALVRRTTGAGYVVVPFDTRVADEVFEARLAIELGVVELAMGQVSANDVAGLRASYASMAQWLVDDHFVDFDRYLDANHEFHKAFVALADNPSLVSMFEALSTRSIMAKSFGSTPQSSQRFLDVQARIVAAFEARDKAGARAAAQTYCELAKERVRQVLALTGGEL